MEAQRVTTYGDGRGDLHGTLLDLMAGCTTRLWIKVPWWDESARARELSDAGGTPIRMGHRRGT